MSVQLTGTAGWGTRFGRCAWLANQVDAFRGQQTDAQVSAIYSQFQTDEQIAVTQLYSNRDAYRGAHLSWLSSIQGVAQTATIEQVNRDDPLPNKQITTALQQLVAQLTANGTAISRPTITVTPTAGGSNTGDAVLAASAADPSDGGVFDYCFSENFAIQVSQDAAGGATAYRETCSVNGDPKRSQFDYNWPGGSGVQSATLTAIDGEVDTLVTDGAFELWTGDTPQKWTAVTGASTITKGSSPLRGSANLKITSDGATQTRLRSLALTLSPLTAYALGFWVKIDTTAAGTLVVKLVDGSGNTIADAASTDNILSLSTSSDVSTSYACKSAFFRTPRALPSTVYLDIHLTSAPTAGRIIQLDTLSLTTASQLYAGGPYVALFSGATKIVRQDKWTLAVANSHTTANMSRSLDRFFSLRDSGVKFPSTTGSAAIPDTLIAQG